MTDRGEGSDEPEREGSDEPDRESSDEPEQETSDEPDCGRDGSEPFDWTSLRDKDHDEQSQGESQPRGDERDRPRDSPESDSDAESKEQSTDPDEPDGRGGGRSSQQDESWQWGGQREEVAPDETDGERRERRESEARRRHRDERTNRTRRDTRTDRTDHEQQRRRSRRSRRDRRRTGHGRDRRSTRSPGASRGKRSDAGGERDHQPPPTDPVKRQFEGRVDLYDIATWEPRTALDSLSVSVVAGLRSARTFLLVSLATVLFLAQMAVVAVLIVEEPLLAALALFSVAPALAVAAYIWYRDPTRREPFVLLAATFVLSMLFAGFAAVVNSIFLPAFEVLGVVGLVLFFFVVVGPIEELVKWLAIRVYAYKSDVFRTVIDGAVYGAMAGVGFAAIENLFYIAIVYLETAPAGDTIQVEYATSVAGQRAFAGPGHVIFSAWAGFYLGLAKFNPGNYAPIAAKGLLIAAFIHALYNTVVTVLPAVLGLSVPALLAIIVLYHGFWFGLLYRKIAAYRALYRRLGYTPLPAQR